MLKYSFSKMKRTAAVCLCVVLGIGCCPSPVQLNAATTAPKLAKKSVTLKVGKTTTIKVKGKNVLKKEFKSSDSKVASVTKKGKVKAKKVGKAKISVKVKYRSGKVSKKKTLYYSVKVTKGSSTPVPYINPKATGTRPDWNNAEEVIRYYNDPKEQGQPFLNKIYDFSGIVSEEPLSEFATETIASDPAFSELTVKQLYINDMSLYDVNVDDGKKKPLMILIHAAGCNKEFELITAMDMALSGKVRVVAVDAVGHGENKIKMGETGPLESVVIFAETVYQIDTLIEYYNTQKDVDAQNFGICGASMGGSITFAYVAHGLYKPTAIGSKIATPDFTTIIPLLTEEESLSETAKEQIKEFAIEYSPSKWPLRYKDTYIFAANGMKDPVNGPEGCKNLEKALDDAGSNKHSFTYFEDAGHDWDLPIDLNSKVLEKLVGDA